MNKFYLTTLLLTLLFISDSTAQAVGLSWVKQMGGPEPEHCLSINIDPSGNILTTGYFSDTADFDPGLGIFNLNGNANDVNIFISKLDGSGNFIWAKQIGGSDFDVGKSITTDLQGNIFITGRYAKTVDFDPGPGIFNLTSGSNSSAFILKLDPSGNFIWAKKIQSTLSDGSSIKVDAAGNNYSTGFFTGTANFDLGVSNFSLTSTGGYDGYILKLDSSGNFIWAKKLGGSSTDYGMGLATDGQTNVYVTGEFQGTVDFDPGTASFPLTSTGLNDAFVIKLDTSGNFKWARKMGSDSIDFALTIALDPSGNVLTTGYFTKSGDFDPGSNTFTMSALRKKDVFISKLDGAGNFMWAKQIGGIGGISGLVYLSLVTDASGNVYTTGAFRDTADFDPGPSSYNLISGGQYDMFISKLDVSGNFVWAKRIGDNTSYGEGGTGIAVDASGNIFTTGYFGLTVDFDPDAGVFNLTSHGEWDMFVHKMSVPGSGIDNHEWGTQLTIYPNPTSGILSIKAPYQQYTIEVFNLVGETIYSSQVNSCYAMIDLSNQPKGIYFVKTVSEKGISTGRVVIE